MKTKNSWTDSNILFLINGLSISVSVLLIGLLVVR